MIGSHWAAAATVVVSLSLSVVGTMAREGERTTVVDRHRELAFETPASWTQVPTVPPTFQNVETRGMALSSDGAILVLAGDNENLRVFQNSGTRAKPVWNQVGQTIVGSDQFGEAIDISDDGTRMIVGASYATNDAGKIFAGKAFLFELQGDQWVETASFEMPIESSEDQGVFFGTDVFISNDGRRIAIYAPGVVVGDNSGALFVFQETGGQWVRGFGREEDVFYGIPGHSLFWRNPFGLSDDGTRIAVSGNTEALGVRVFELPIEHNGENWEQLGNSINHVFTGDPSYGFYPRIVGMSGNGRRIALTTLSVAGKQRYFRVYEFAEGADDWLAMGEEFLVVANIDANSSAFSNDKVSLNYDGTVLAIEHETTAFIFQLVTDAATGDSKWVEAIAVEDGAEETSTDSSSEKSSFLDVSGDGMVFAMADRTSIRVFVSSVLEPFVEPWSIKAVGVDARFGGEFETEEITLTYIIDEKPYTVAVMEPTCNSVVDPSIIGATNEYAKNDLTINLDIFPSKLRATTELWNAEDSTFSVCVRVDLITYAPGVIRGERGPTSVRFLEAIVGVEVDFSAGFNIIATKILAGRPSPLNLSPDEAAEIYGVDACQCDADDTCYPEDAAPLLGRDDPLKVCINAAAEEVGLVSVQEFFVKQAAFSFVAVRGGTISNQDLTAVEATSDKTAIVTTHLFSLFFETSETDLIVTGTFGLYFLAADGSRRLAMTEVPINVRGLREEASLSIPSSFEVGSIRLKVEDFEGDEEAMGSVMLVVLAGVGAVVAVVGLILILVAIVARRRRGKRADEPSGEPCATEASSDTRCSVVSVDRSMDE